MITEVPGFALRQDWHVRELLLLLGIPRSAPGRSLSERYDMKRNCLTKEIRYRLDPVYSLRENGRGYIIGDVISCLSIKATPSHPGPSYSLQY